MSKNTTLQTFLRSHPVRSFEVTRVAKSMDETELEVEITQVGKVNGLEKYFDSTLHFVGMKVDEMPWAKMQIVRCRAMGENPGTFEMVDAKGAKVEIRFKECTVTYPDDYDQLYSRS